ncbi:low molecular weight protein-tyrosine-phosphatase [Zoogloea sp. LCSB751]|uniref:low molecular weight protein-tyrosine-phosphatase n=1 Tax=Zoogloea sp. LCSB751 TaxID=1965277 RepID=UPI0009A521F6|nr:low molecular weight protein-tyrosine-phosphatase [Zoogloea sp. LCSB751]
MKILFVCTGNICRSPTAEGVARRWLAMAGLGELVGVDSAGTQGYHVGEAPDPRSQSAALRRGYDLSRLRARKVEAKDFAEFDLLLAMDREHFQYLRDKAPEGARHKVRMFMSYARTSRRDDVPDPYYGGATGFDAVLDMCEDAMQGLVEEILPEVNRRQQSLT